MGYWACAAAPVENYSVVTDSHGRRGCAPVEMDMDPARGLIWFVFCLIVLVLASSQLEAERKLS